MTGRQNLPLEPLRRFFGPVFQLGVGVTHRDVEGADVTALADIVGVAKRSVHRWSVEGVPVHRADKVAVALGVHPSAIWSEWFDLEVAS